MASDGEPAADDETTGDETAGEGTTIDETPADDKTTGDETPAGDGATAAGWLDPQRKSALLWGLVGAFSFGVLYQGYVLVASAPWDAVVLLAGATLVGAITVVLASRLEPRLAKESL